MNFRRSSAVALLLGAVAIVTGCGGGGEATGALTAFNVSPSSITLTGPAGVPTAVPPVPGLCASGFASRVFVFGGAPPYSVYNPLPDILFVSRTSLSSPGEYFDVVITAVACMDTIPITVVDRTGRQVAFTVTSEKGADN